MPDDRGKLTLKLRVSPEQKEQFDRAVFARGFRGRGAMTEAMTEAVKQWTDWVAKNYGEPELRKRTADATPKGRGPIRGVVTTHVGNEQKVG